MKNRNAPPTDLNLTTEETDFIKGLVFEAARRAKTTAQAAQTYIESNEGLHVGFRNNAIFAHIRIGAEACPCGDPLHAVGYVTAMVIVDRATHIDMMFALNEHAEEQSNFVFSAQSILNGY